MTKNAKSFLVVCTLVLAAMVLHAGAAAACTARCVKVAEPFCRRCLDVGEYTGITCEDSGNCGCFFTQNTCGLSLAGIQAQPDLAAVIPADKGAACSTAPASEDDLLNSLLR
jgi:hypothetical protein